jgi:PKD repeat protein
MRLGRDRWAGLAVIAAGVLGAATLAAGTAGAAMSPRAGLSINPAKATLSATFVASSMGFSAPVVSYKWAFGDRSTATTQIGAVTHRYRSEGRFIVTVTETDGKGDRATAKGTLELFTCKVGEAICTVALDKAGAVSSLRASGPQNPNDRASVNLFVGPFRIAACESSVAPAVGVTDSGFSGNLTVTMDYTTHQPKQVDTTCFSSTVTFVDAADHVVHSGALPSCRHGKAPCVKSISVVGLSVKKVLIVPPGDPKVGAP